jgi:hypothetical protein
MFFDGTPISASFSTTPGLQMTASADLKTWL